MCLGNHHLQDVATLELGILAPEVSHERIGVVAGVRVEVGPAPHLVRFRDAVIGPPVDLVADRTTGLESQPAHGAQHQDVDADPVLQRVQNRVYALVYETDGTHLDADEGVLRFGRAHEAVLTREVKEAMRSTASWIIGSGWR